MKRFLPYFAYLKPVRKTFLIGVLCGVLYGLASGFGLPFMTSKIFPLIFSSEHPSGTVFVATDDGQSLPLGPIKSIDLPEGLFFRSPSNELVPVPVNWSLRANGDLIAPGHATPIHLDELLLRDENGQLHQLSPGFFLKNQRGERIALDQKGFEPPNFWLLVGAVSILPLTFLLRGVSGFFNTYLIRDCGTRVLEQLRLDVFAHLQELPLSFYQQHPTGDLMSRITNDTSKLQSILTLIANDLIKQPITFLGALGALIVLSLQENELAFILLLLGAIPLCVLPVRYAGKKLLAKAKLLQKESGTLTSILSEHLGAIKEVRAFNLQQREYERFATSLRRMIRSTMKIVKYTNALPPAIETITAVGVAIAIYYSASKGIGIETVIPLIFALYMAYDPIKKLGGIHNKIKEGAASLERLEYLLHTPIDIRDPENPVKLHNIRGELECHNLSFRYQEEYVLRDINLRIAAGETVALVGPSGAGKTTLAHLVPRFYDVSVGNLTLDGVDVRQLRQHDLREAVAIVSQDPILFNESVADNIRCGRDVPLPAVIEAAGHAHAHAFIEDMPEGYETILGERGTRLSGGQKQRIALARAFLKNAPILILDEATSALDSESEEKIQAALQELVRGKTVLIIAHRFSTLKLVDRIVVMEAGHILAEGTHEHLYASNALYQALYDKQSL